MNEDIVIQLGQDALKTLAMLSAPLLISTLVIGLIVSIFQAATQINEQTLTFIPKIIAMTAVMAFFGPWMLQQMLNFTIEIFQKIPLITH